MATVDSFELLARELMEVCGSFRDALALIGALYIGKKTLTFSFGLCRAFRTYFWPRYVIGPWADLPQRFGKWAVITGSSEGIGKAYAEELASRGVNVILLSRGQKKLEATAKKIEEEFGVETHCIYVDFNAGPEIYPHIRAELEGKEVGILVNNVGVMYDYPQKFLDVPEERLWQLVNVNVAAATMMTRLVLPQMLERGKGAIINMASGASCQPTPQMNVYAATKLTAIFLPKMIERKRGLIINVSAGSCCHPTPQMTVYSASNAYMDYFSRALHHEYKDEGIIVQSLMPFYVATKMTKFSTTLSSQNLFIPSAATFAHDAVSTLGYSTRTAGYWPHAIQCWFSALIPECLWMWGATRLNNALRRQATQRIRHRSGTKMPSSLSTGSLSTGSLSDIDNEDGKKFKTS